MKRILLTIALLSGIGYAADLEAQTVTTHESDTTDTTDTTVPSRYTPTAENLCRRAEFEGFRLGIFIHWGIYSTFAQGEWYLSSGLDKDEYAKAADAFYPHRFDALQWVRAAKGAGARYITFTTRHHDGFSMWATRQSDYNIVQSTPFGRDVLRELAEACEAEGMRLHLYYSLLDWIRDDYPTGRTLRRKHAGDYDSYFGFMKRQLHELLTEYGPSVGGLWLDGWWDHKDDAQPFDWRLEELYSYVHGLRPELLIGNNHHTTTFDGEDFQMFERDLPGENKAGMSGQQISRLPLEMCQTMNGMWGYKVSDTRYKSTDTLVELIVRAAGKGSNLLLNVGPQPNGEFPAASLERLQGIGRWMERFGGSIYDTAAGPYADEWGVSTRRGERVFLHVLERTADSLTIATGRRPRSVSIFDEGEGAEGVDGANSPEGAKSVKDVNVGKGSEGLTWRYDRRTGCTEIVLPPHADSVDLVVAVELR